MAANGKLLVFADLPGGELDETGRGLLSYGGRLAGVLDSPWGVATLQEPTREPLASFAAYGVPSVTTIAGGELLLDTPAHLGKALARLATDEGASVTVLPHNDLGSTLAPVIAAALDGALLTEVVSVRREGETLRLSRHALGVRVDETKVWDGSRPLVITVPVRNLSQVLMPTVQPSIPNLTVWHPVAAPEGATARVGERIPPDPQTVDLMEAEVIFSAGKGCDQATFDQLAELCRLMNVSFGVTRPVYDLGWTGFERMVGQTGRTVTPRFYLALGISGSMHHVGGIKDSRRIISINSDAKAPIFANSDEGFVADLKEVLPRLLDRARSEVGGTP
ncbi:electron transfer flavoprotein subunit alpha/FixB family protein [Geobacter pickeringii]|uniref:Electron transfer flavoprotein subunit alpha n=1 Tax=Geobacter pickeringii TaxID=345632 RepID=A0A0B5B8Q2_9BACT|nr:electron transfer flavoprotein subunit alpha/FixB family protein [Geobacter pickeringii]AJE03083.1 electron transfer flavoprotein subunit alpha [Geobacter pickeringii]